MINKNTLFQCVQEISKCADGKDIAAILDKYDLALEEQLLCCIASSCSNRLAIEEIKKLLLSQTNCAVQNGHFFSLKNFKKRCEQGRLERKIWCS